MNAREEYPAVAAMKKSTGAPSRQPDDLATKWTVEPPISFSALRKAYEGSFILGGAFAKLASAADTKFVETGDSELDAVLATVDRRFVFESILVYGNSFMEIVRDGRGKIDRLERMMTDTVSVWMLGSERGYLQQVSGKRQFFLPEEVVHAKTSSVVSRYYGDSRFSRAVDQIILLAQIDKYYSSMFDRWMLGSNMFSDNGDKDGKPLSKENRDALIAWFEDFASGVDNAFTTAIVPTNLERINLDKDVDTKAFLEYRYELIESIAMALNVPVDLLTPKNSNRSTSETSYEILSEIIVAPMQEEFLDDLRESLRPEFGNAVDEIKMDASSYSDDLKEMKVLTGYKRSGILTANEVRALRGLAPLQGGDALSVDSAGAEDPSGGSSTVEKEASEILEKIAKSYDVCKP